MEKTDQNEKKRKLQRLKVIPGPDQERDDVAAVKGRDPGQGRDRVQGVKKRDLGAEIGGQEAETDAQGAGTGIQGVRTSGQRVGTGA